MAANDGIRILDTIPDLFAQMSTGSALGLQLKEIVRRLLIIRARVPWSTDQARASSKLRARAAAYAMRYQPDDGRTEIRLRNEVRLDEVRAAFLELRSHLLIEAAKEASVEHSLAPT